MINIFSKRWYGKVMTNQKILLLKVTQLLNSLSYTDILHQRISYSIDAAELHYQGLTRAQHQHFGQVMIKWTAYDNGVNNDNNEMVFTSDIAVMTDLNTDQITPPLLNQHQLRLALNNQSLIFHAIVMPYYKMGSLAQYLKQLLSDWQKHGFIIKSARLLADLHQSGWLHNDIKPSNILIDDKTLRLTDFALASHIDNDKQANKAIAGTPAYLAPERWQGQSATVKSDIYAFGVMMFEVLMNTRPFNIDKNSDHPSQMWAIEHCQSSIPILPKAYTTYQSIINKALAKRTENRYQAMDEVVADLNCIDNPI